jgi:hypothetical protein
MPFQALGECFREWRYSNKADIVSRRFQSISLPITYELDSSATCR